MTSRVLIFIYGALNTAVFFATVLYAIGFADNFAVHKPLDSVSGGAWPTTLLIDLGLLVPGLGRRGVSPRALAVKAATDSGGLVQP
jgi:hypothetical protein